MKKYTPTEKIMWTTGFLFFNLITGIIYFFFARKRVIRNYKLRSPLT
ncbi:PLDc N-terminal domain-containing protein [Arcticibacter pallidicorallinus]